MKREFGLVTKSYRYNPANYPVSCLDIPATVQVVKASVQQPYGGITLELQPSVVYQMLQEIPPIDNPGDT